MKRSINSQLSSINPWLTLVVVCFAQFMVVLDATVVNVALPSIQTDLDFSDSSLQWVVNGYTLLFGGFLLLGGRLADLIGRRRLFVVGTAIFGVASLINGLATSDTMLIGARALQGFGAALVSPAALSIITTTFREGEQRTKALAVWGAIAAGGAAAGLLLGGVLTEFLSWEWVFFVNVPIAIATIVAAFRLVPESRNEAQVRHFDIAGAATVTSGLIVLVYAIVKSTDWGWGSPSTLGLIALGAALLGAFVAIERRSHAPLVRLDLFKLRSLATANGVMLLVYLRDDLHVLLLHPVPAEGARLLGAGDRGRVPAGELRDRDRLGARAAADRPPGDQASAGGRHDAGGGRARGARRDDLGRRDLPGAAGRVHAAGDRHGPDLRAPDPGRHHQRLQGGRGPRVRRVQHLPAGGRRARARGALHVRQRPDGERARRRCAAERGAGGRVPDSRS